MASARIELACDRWSLLGPLLAALGYLVMLTALGSLVSGFDLGRVILPGLIVAGSVIWILVRSRRPALVAGHAGVQVASQVRYSWSDVRLVWVVGVGPTGFLSSTRHITVRAYSPPSLQYAHRTGFAPTIAWTLRVWTSRPPEEIADLLRGVALSNMEIRAGAGLATYVEKLRSGDGPAPESHHE